MLLKATKYKGVGIRYWNGFFKLYDNGNYKKRKISVCERNRMNTITVPKKWVKLRDISKLREFS